MIKKEILEFMHHAEKLKHVLRHSWLSNGMQESAAEHSWRMSLMAMMMADKVEHKIDLCKALKMIIVHDIAEAEAGDVPAFMHKERAEVKKLEKESIEKIKEKYKDPAFNEICELWLEYEEGKTPEAIFVKALDKIEVRIQHNEADIKTWIDVEYPRSQFVSDRFCEHDKFLKEFNELVKEESKNKIIKESAKDFDEILKEVEELRHSDKE